MKEEEQEKVQFQISRSSSYVFKKMSRKKNVNILCIVREFLENLM